MEASQSKGGDTIISDGIAPSVERSTTQPAGAQEGDAAVSPSRLEQPDIAPLEPTDEITTGGIGARIVDGLKHGAEAIQEKGHNVISAPKGRTTIGIGIVAISSGIGIAAKKRQDAIRSHPSNLIGKVKEHLPFSR